MSEEFRTIKTHENYEVSNYGRVRNKITRRILKASTSGDKYSRVTLDRKKYRIHRLVALEFIPNPKNYSQVQHRKNTNKLDNCVGNLRWGDHTTNALTRKGCTIVVKKNKFYPEFLFKGTQYKLGSFSTRNQALSAVKDVKNLLVLVRNQWEQGASKHCQE
jgi:hypothetical protein